MSRVRFPSPAPNISKT